MLKVNISIRTDGWDYVEVTTGTWEVGTGQTTTDLRSWAALGSEEGHLALERALQWALGEIQQADEAALQARSPA